MQQPKIGGEVRPHQDSTFLRTDPPSVVGLWWALEDSTKQNGCLWALPGIHKQGVARHFIRKWASSATLHCPAIFVPEQAVCTVLHSAGLWWGLQAQWLAVGSAFTFDTVLHLWVCLCPASQI